MLFTIDDKWNIYHIVLDWAPVLGFKEPDQTKKKWFMLLSHYQTTLRPLFKTNKGLLLLTQRGQIHISKHGKGALLCLCSMVMFSKNPYVKRFFSRWKCCKVEPSGSLSCEEYHWIGKRIPPHSCLSFPCLGCEQFCYACARIHNA